MDKKLEGTVNIDGLLMDVWYEFIDKDTIYCQSKEYNNYFFYTHYKSLTIQENLSWQEAHEAYCNYKANIIREVAKQESDIRVKNALLHRANTFHLEE